METKINKIRKSEYNGYFEVEAVINGNTFNSLAVFSKSQIRNIFNLTDEEFEQLRK